MDDGDVRVEVLEAEDAATLTALVRRCYGDSYDAAWIYDPEEIGTRIRAGVLHSTIGLTADGEVVGHVGLVRTRAADDVAESGQAVVDPAFRGHHLFTLLKQRAAAWARQSGLFGLYSEATAAHPYSQRANVALGAVETGVLLGYIPASVQYTAIDARVHRQSVVLYYLKTNVGHRRPIYPPTRDRAMIARIVANAGLRGVVADVPRDAVIAPESAVHVDHRADHNHVVVTARTVGSDIGQVVSDVSVEARANSVNCVYVDLPLADPGTQRFGHEVRDVGFSFGGIFPNRLHDCDVVRYQLLNEVVERDASDISLASDHGRELLAYVLE